MTTIDYIGANELIFNTDKESGIHSGGFSVKSIMMKAGMSPIMTINNNHNEKSLQSGGNVSDLFDSLVVPSWVLSYNNPLSGGSSIRKEYENDDKIDESDESDEEIDDDLHDKLLELVKEHDYKQNAIKKRKTRKHLTTIHNGTKKGGKTKRHL
jgi:hypothetical protein